MTPDQTTERRRAERFLFKASATLQRASDGETLRARLMNASETGVLLSVKMETPLAVGERVVCELNMPFGLDIGTPTHGAGRVARIDGDEVAVEFDPVE